MRALFLTTLAVIWCVINTEIVSAQQYTGFVITGQSNIFGAGFNDAPAPGGGTGGVTAPVAFITIPGPAQLTFSSVTGTVQCAVPEPFNGPDGGTAAGGVTNIFPFRDLSGIMHSNRTMFLIGVFRDSSPGMPAGTPPISLGFSDPENFSTLSPQLNQLFFVGDGLADITGGVQSFLVPTGATRLYLGFADGFSFVGLPGHYSDNAGQLTANFAFTAIPEPSTIMFVVLASFGSFVLLYRHRRNMKRTQEMEVSIIV